MHGKKSNLFGPMRKGLIYLPLATDAFASISSSEDDHFRKRTDIKYLIKTVLPQENV